MRRFVPRCPVALPITTLLAAAASLASCGPDGGSTLVQAGDAYSAADYGQAVLSARVSAKSAQGVQLDQARYIEGMAQWKLGREDEAARLLALAGESADRSVATDAQIGLGSLEFQRDRARQGADAYARAAENLDGAERRRAFAIAVRGYEQAEMASAANALRSKAGLPPPEENMIAKPSAQAASADRDVRRAESLSSSTAKKEIANKPESNYAIQAGAFSDRARAEATASIVRERARGTSLGEPRIVVKQRANGKVYVVQIGAFPNRGVAGKAMAPFAKLAFTVEPFAE